MLRESMGGESVQVSEGFPLQIKQQQQQQQQQSSGLATSTGGPAYAPMHYSGSNNSNITTLSPSNGGHDDAQQQQQQQHYQQQHQLLSAAMASGALSQPTCLVCYNAQVDVVLEPCRHQFHAHCIDRWLTKDKVCPVCWHPIQTQRRLMPQQYAGAPPPGSYALSPAAVPTSSAVNAPAMDASVAPQVAPPSTVAVAAAPMVNEQSAQQMPTVQTPAAVAAAATRKGKWTAEESLYCDRLIEEFKKGNLPLAEGTTLRTFLAKLLNCDPMRISKKYTGDQCIGKIIFRRREDEVSKDDMELIRRDLAELEKTYLEREQYNQRRREKRLESELSRDKSRYIAARSLGGYNAPQQPQATTAAASAATGAAAAAAAARAQAAAAAVSSGHYHQAQQQQQHVASSAAPMATKDMNMAASHQALHHAPFPPTRGPMPLQANANVHPPRYPLHAPPSQQQHQLQHQLQHQQHQQQQQASGGHLFISSAQSAAPHESNVSDASRQNSSSGISGGAMDSSAYMAASHSTGGSSSSGQAATSQHQLQQHQHSHPPQEHQHQQQSVSGSDAFPRVSSIDSFSCLFPRVASIDNFQLPHQGGSGSGTSNSHSGTSGFGTNALTYGDVLQHTYDPHAGGLVKSLSIGDGLNAYFPRVQSLEQLSTLLEAHAPPSPRTSSSSSTTTTITTKSENRSETESTDRKQSPPFDAPPPTSGSIKEEQQPQQQQRETDQHELQRRLSPNSTTKAPEGSNQMQIPKPLSKMPRSSSGIFPRIPSMDKLPRIPSLDKLSHMATATGDRLPRVPSLDKLSRIPSHSDMLSRFGSSDHLSSFPSFSNLTSLSTCASFTNLSGLSGGGVGGSGGFKSGFPRNSSIEDILSLVASSESSGGMASAGSHLQLSALAAVAGEESSQLAAAADRKRRMEQQVAQEQQQQQLESKKSKLSA